MGVWCFVWNPSPPLTFSLLWLSLTIKKIFLVVFSYFLRNMQFYAYFWENIISWIKLLKTKVHNRCFHYFYFWWDHRRVWNLYLQQVIVLFQNNTVVIMISTIYVMSIAFAINNVDMFVLTVCLWYSLMTSQNCLWNSFYQSYLSLYSLSTSFNCLWFIDHS